MTAPIFRMLNQLTIEHARRWNAAEFKANYIAEKVAVPLGFGYVTPQEIKAIEARFAILLAEDANRNQETKPVPGIFRVQETMNRLDRVYQVITPDGGVVAAMERENDANTMADALNGTLGLCAEKFTFQTFRNGL